PPFRSQEQRWPAGLPSRRPGRPQPEPARIEEEAATMTPAAVHFHCPGCRARIKAPAQLRGQSRNCPRCRVPLTVPFVAPEDAGPVLVMLEEPDRFVLGVLPRTATPPLPANRAYPSKQVG